MLIVMQLKVQQNIYDVSAKLRFLDVLDSSRILVVGVASELDEAGSLTFSNSEVLLQKPHFIYKFYFEKRGKRES